MTSVARSKLVFHAKLDADHCLTFPLELCRRYGLEPGATIVLESTDVGIVVKSLDVVIREAQAVVRRYVPPGVLLSEELLRERREEAAREEADADRE